MTFQLPACFTHVALWRLASHESVARLLWMHTTWVFFTLSHTQPLHNFHLNTGYLIAKIHANLTRNKINTWLNKFNLVVVKEWRRSLKKAIKSIEKSPMCIDEERLLMNSVCVYLKKYWFSSSTCYKLKRKRRLVHARFSRK